MMELIPQMLTARAVMPPGSDQDPTRRGATKAVLNRIWNDLSEMDFRTLDIAPGGDAAQFAGDDQFVGINPPLVQVSQQIGASGATAEQAAVRAEQILRCIGNHFRLNQCFNLDIQLIYQLTLRNNDGDAFILAHFLQPAAIGLGDIADRASGGVRFHMQHDADTFSIIRIETLVEDPTRLYLDVEAYFANPVDLDRVQERAAKVEEIVNQIRNYLDKTERGDSGGQ
jgi:hypothetical protein